MSCSKYLLFTFISVCFSSLNLNAQENPPIPVQVEVSTAQSLNFGAFVVGNATGTVSIDSYGFRTPGGSVTLLNMGDPESAALFDVYANPGTIINITHSDSFSLSGTSGDEIILKLDSYSTGKTFITTQNSDIPNPVTIGGTLYLESNVTNRPGKYYGTIYVTFNQQ
ncbi:DUF4402 domain-containing protein [Christiangramia forsetii]|uniref:Secreted protein n=2 Tax=Christiangramia forsetii TaxID=411153 RepID=A0M1N3_CHRFK|nr:DUF4402 domain-containing protein [Christiangramia forsetii]GGG42092.1 hypothetical protein GCM10011532_27380 [Christiangramia forsetii]CAL66528.1 secreted protein [Christiangramia forsetii KT0803]